MILEEAASKAVKLPSQISKIREEGVKRKRGDSLSKIKIPAVTIVEE